MAQSMLWIVTEVQEALQDQYLVLSVPRANQYVGLVALLLLSAWRCVMVFASPRFEDSRICLWRWIAHNSLSIVAPLLVEIGELASFLPFFRYSTCN
jgi:hypothetical protein